jgi:hypothetical protein
MKFTCLSTLRRLTLAQWGCLWAAYWRLWVVQIKIKWAEPGWWLTKVQIAGTEVSAYQNGDTPTSNENTNSDHSINEPDQLFEIVRLAARMHLWQTACLPRSIVLADMLNAALGDNQAVLLLGVQQLGAGNADPSIASHAWVELDGRVVGEAERVAKQFTQIAKHLSRD